VPFAISRPAQLHKLAASTRAQPICLKLSATASLSFWINRRAIELFCAQVFGIRKGQAISYSAAPSKNPRDQLSGAASRGARITRPTVERLTPIFRASSLCVAFGLAATSLAIFAHTAFFLLQLGFRSAPLRRCITPGLNRPPQLLREETVL
jgi:hypothetical protein